ncbi:MAG: Hsp20/alpha crystallin family protein [Rhodobiaceae bacterium]|nr:Hsp20/alpha crystallin family protein [Rhodobiaceae bacterium]
MVESSHTAGFWPSLYEPFRSLGGRVADWFAPASEATSNGDAYEIVMELPGVKQNDIDISISENTLTVMGEKQYSQEKSEDNYYFSERQYGSFRRSFRLPSDANAGKVGAAFKDGVLTITVPRMKEPETGAKKVKITSS